MGIANKDRATFSIDRAIKETLEERIPAGRRSEFVEDAIADALRRDAVSRLRGTLDDIAGSATGGESSVELLRRLRDRRLREIVGPSG